MSDLDELVRRSLKAPVPTAELASWGEIELRVRARRRRQRRRGIVLGALTLATAAALLFGSSSNGSGPSPLARASAAVVGWPPDEILHMRIVTRFNFPQADFVQETWQLTSPPYTLRTRMAFPANGTDAQVVESAEDANGFAQIFDWRTDRIVQTASAPSADLPTGLEQATHDQMLALVNNGDWKSIGASEVDGHQVLGFASDTDRLYLDARTYLPVLDQSFGFGVGAERLGYDAHYTWEILPASSANLGLLNVASDHAGAAVVSGPASTWSATSGELGQLWKPPVTPGA